MTYTRKLIRLSNSGRSEFIETYEQPLINLLHYKVVHWVWLAHWKIPPVWFIINKLIEPILKRHHRRLCDGDCGEATRCADGERIKICIRMPLTNAFDCYEHDLNHRNNKILRP